MLFWNHSETGERTRALIRDLHTSRKHGQMNFYPIQTVGAWHRKRSQVKQPVRRIEEKKEFAPDHMVPIYYCFLLMRRQFNRNHAARFLNSVIKQIPSIELLVRKSKITTSIQSFYLVNLFSIVVRRISRCVSKTSILSQKLSTVAVELVRCQGPRLPWLRNNERLWNWLTSYDAMGQTLVGIILSGFSWRYVIYYIICHRSWMLDAEC